MEIVAALSGAGLKAEEVITAGTPAFPCTLSYSRFNEGPFIHRASPGTVVYGNCSALPNSQPRTVIAPPRSWSQL